MDLSLSSSLYLLVPIAVHSCDVITTKKLLSICKGWSSDFDIWKLKFEHEFPNKKYLDFAFGGNENYYTNYRIQKCNNMSLLLSRNANGENVSNIIHEYSPIYDLIINFSDDSNNNNDSMTEFVRIRFDDRFIILENYESCGFEIVSFHPSYDKAMKKQQAMIGEYTENNKDCMNSKLVEHFLIDLAGMIPYFIGDKLIFTHEKKNKRQHFRHELTHIKGMYG